MSGGRDIIFAEYFKLFDRAAPKKLLDADDVTTSRKRKLQDSKNGLYISENPKHKLKNFLSFPWLWNEHAIPSSSIEPSWSLVFRVTSNPDIRTDQPRYEMQNVLSTVSVDHKLTSMFVPKSHHFSQRGHTKSFRHRHRRSWTWGHLVLANKACPYSSSWIYCIQSANHIIIQCLSPTLQNFSCGLLTATKLVTFDKIWTILMCSL